MSRFRVYWRNGGWFIETPISGDGAALDAWLAERGDRTRAELDFDGNRALEQRFIHDFGPISGRRTPRR